MFIVKILLFLIIFSLIVMVHELGHMLLAKKNHIGVNEFSIGMGPVLASFVKGETKYSIRLFPFGGACMFEGEDGISEKSNSFQNASVFARISAVAAGPVFNFILILCDFTSCTPIPLHLQLLPQNETHTLTHVHTNK